MKRKIIGILVCTLFILTSFSFVSAEPATDSEITSFDSEITIAKPNGYVYIFNIPIAPLPGQVPFRSIIIGIVDVKVNVGDSVDKVEHNIIREALKVVGIEKKIEVAALGFSEQAGIKLKKAGCDIKSIKIALEKNPKLEGVKIL